MAEAAKGTGLVASTGAAREERGAPASSKTGFKLATHALFLLAE